MKVLLLLVLLCGAATARAEFFRWTDARGTVHYTNRMDDVPEKYRAKVKVMYFDTDTKSPAPTASPAPGASPAPVASPAPAPPPEAAPTRQEPSPGATIRPTPAARPEPPRTDGQRPQTRPERRPRPHREDE